MAIEEIAVLMLAYWIYFSGQEAATWKKHGKYYKFHTVTSVRGFFVASGESFTNANLCELLH